MPHLARLRGDLDFFPSPDKAQPGLVIRDPMRYSDTVLIIPPDVVPYLSLLDGEQDAPEGLKPLTDALARSGFLHDENFWALREAKHLEFERAPVRLASHAGSAYPEDPRELRLRMDSWMAPAPSSPASSRRLIGIAAPHVSPEGGVDSYRAAYSLLTPEYRNRTFVVLGTSHYGAPGRLGITRKPFVTPFGQTRTAEDLVAELGPNEDYCHAVEHSIEFQVLFLQSIYGPDVEVLPILCGSYAESVMRRELPEQNEAVRRLLDSLAEINAREQDRLFWILGIDMAHIGRRYQDDFAAEAGRGAMQMVEARDRDRIARIAAGDAPGFWELMGENHEGARQDELKWCGSAPVYTFLRAVPEARAALAHYQQWNIDPESVVSFAAMQLYKE